VVSESCDEGLMAGDDPDAAAKAAAEKERRLQEVGAGS
jgi:hypothetical protein